MKKRTKRGTKRPQNQKSALSLSVRYQLYEAGKKNPDLTMTYENWAKEFADELNL